MVTFYPDTFYFRMKLLSCPIIPAVITPPFMDTLIFNFPIFKGGN